VSDSSWYLRAIGRVPMLTPAEEIELGARVQRWLTWQPSPEDAPRHVQRQGKRAKDRIVEANLRLVVSIAGKFSKLVDPNSFMDLVQAGNLGLMRGAELFDPTRGYKFSTYAYWWIRQGITRYLQTQWRMIRLPPSIQDKLSQIKALRRQLQREPSRAELIEALGIKQADLEKLLLLSMPCGSLDASVRDMEEGSALVDIISVKEEQDEPDERVPSILSLLDQLDDLSRRALVAYWGLDGEAHTIKAIAKEQGCSTDRTTKRIRQAEARLRFLAGVQVSSPLQVFGSDAPFGVVECQLAFDLSDVA